MGLMDDRVPLEVSMTKRVLFIAYSFPPHGGMGVQRSVKFVRYLPNYHWQPTVLTTSARSTLTDPEMARQVSPETTIVRVGGLVLPVSWPWRLRYGIRQWILTVDDQIGWLPFSVRRARQLMKRNSFDLIYSTSGPYTDHLVALRLKRKTGLPWVADFRDPWLDNYSQEFATKAHRALCAHLEQQIIEAADQVLVVNEQMRTQFLNRYSSLSPSNCIVLPNGFDPNDYEGLKPVAHDGRFTLVHAGSLYGTRVQSVRVFLLALARCFQNQGISRRKICVRFVGRAGHEAQEQVQTLGLGDVVEFLGHLPHQEALAHQLAADLLLLVVGSGPGSSAVATGKIYEYLAAGKPILALTPASAAADLLEEAQVGMIAPPDDPKAIVSALTRLYRDWREGRLQAAPDPSFLARYDRRNQAARLAQIFDELSQPAGQTRGKIA